MAPGTFYTLSSVLGLRVSKFVSFTNRLLVSYSSLTLLKLSPADFQSQTWGLIFLVQVLQGEGMPYMGPEPLAPQEGPLCL